MRHALDGLWVIPSSCRGGNNLPTCLQQPRAREHQAICLYIYAQATRVHVAYSFLAFFAGGGGCTPKSFLAEELPFALASSGATVPGAGVGADVLAFGVSLSGVLEGTCVSAGLSLPEPEPPAGRFEKFSGPLPPVD